MTANDDHMAVWEAENFESAEERRWYAWIDAVERLLGHDPDGDHDTDGYSMDGFHDMFKAGRTPAQAVEGLL
jgi:hypothetical protein